MAVLALVVETTDNGGRRLKQLIVPSYNVVITICPGQGVASLSIATYCNDQTFYPFKTVGDVQCSELFVASAAEFASATDAMAINPKKARQRLMKARGTLLQFRDMFFEAMDYDD